MIETCELYRMIPQEEHDRVFAGTAGAELDSTFLAFEEVYKGIRNFVPKSWTILDIGCGYAAQAYYFRDYKKYIGVTLPMEGAKYYRTENMELYGTSAQEFIPRFVIDNDVSKVFAICSYVPDAVAQQLVRDCFPYHLVYYPSYDREFREF